MREIKLSRNENLPPFSLCPPSAFLVLTFRFFCNRLRQQQRQQQQQQQNLEPLLFNTLQMRSALGQGEGPGNRI
jgi:hypothetical protein